MSTSGDQRAPAAVSVLLSTDRPNGAEDLAVPLRAPGEFDVETAPLDSVTDRAVAKPFHLIVLGVAELGRHEVELARRLRAQTATRRTPILFVLDSADVHQPYDAVCSLGDVDCMLWALAPRLLAYRCSLLTHHRPGADLYRIIVENVANYAIFLLDADGFVRTWNAGARRLKGYEAEEIIGQPYEKFYTPEDAAAGRPREALHRAATEGRFQTEGWRVRKDGTRFWADATLTALHDGTGTLFGFAKVTRDLTERRMADEALRRSEERYRLLVEEVKDYAILMLDPQGNVLTWNAGAERIKGYEPYEIIGKHFSRFFPPEDVAAGKPQRELETALREGRSEEEGWRIRKDGSRFWANAVLTALHDESGRLRGFAKVTRDLTQQKLAEERAAQLAHERAARDEAETRVRARDQFLSIASHELRTPLNPLQLQVQMLLRLARKGNLNGSHGARVIEMLETCDRQVHQFTTLVNDLLDISRIASGRFEIRHEDVDLRALVGEVVHRYATEAGQAGCVVTVRGIGPVIGHWDRLRLDQVVTNLLSNAIKYGRGKPVELAIDATGERARLTVKDEGIGIAPEHHTRIFERFERAVRGYEYGGLGMGLYIVKQIVQALGGTVTVQSAPSAGATFSVELPLQPPLPVAAGAPAVASAPQTK